MVLVADFITAVAIVVEPQFNEPLFNKLLGIMNNIFWPGKSNSKMYETEPLFNKLLDIMNNIFGPAKVTVKCMEQNLDLTNLYLTNSSV